jgi:hypothetical protein
MLRLGKVVSLWFLSAGFGLAACSDDPDPPRSRFVKDAAGRSCTLNDESGRLSCNATPMPSITCSAGEAACFTQGTITSNRAAAVCAGCCRGTNATSVAGDCEQFICGSSGGDCPAGYRCSGTTCLP